LLLVLFSCRHEMPTQPGAGGELPQWPMFAGNLRNTANAADPVEYYPGPERGEVLWRVPINNVFFAAPSIGSDGTIYVAGSLCDCVNADSGFIYAFNADGSLKWKFKTENSNFAAAGALDAEGTYYYGSLDGYLYALSREGKLKWKRKIGPFVTEMRPALTRDGKVVATVGPGIFALDAASGDSLWFYPRPWVLGFTVSVARDGTIYTGTPSSLLALNGDGTLLWSYPLRFGPSGIVIGGDGTVYFAVPGDTVLHALQPDGSPKWSAPLGGMSSNNKPAIAPDGSIYIINGFGNFPYLSRVDQAGKVVSRISLARLVGLPERTPVDVGTSTPMIDKSGNVYITMSGRTIDNLFSIGPDGQQNWSLHIADRALFARPGFSREGILYIGVAGAFVAIW
ncbi:hypothetical protein D6833_04455, partial [Candidatus Parcubacteria bacterium]